MRQAPGGDWQAKERCKVGNPSRHICPLPEPPMLDSLARGAPPLELQMTGKGSKHHLPHTTFRTDGGWEPYGTGRLPGGKGRPAERRWGSLGGWNTKPWGHPSSVPQTQGRLIASGTGADWSYPTSQPSLPTQRSTSARLVELLLEAV